MSSLLRTIALAIVYLVVPEAIAGNLNVTVRNFSGACGSGSTVSGARVIRYTSSWGYLDERTTNSSGVASWSNIPAGTYNLEAYYNGEYWVNGSASVTSGGTTTTTLLRNEPHAYDFKVFKGSTEVTGGSVLTGTALTFRVYVRNCSPVSRLVRVKLWLDRDQTGSDDFSQTSPSQTLSSGGGTAQFDFSYTPTQTGTYNRRLEVETTVVNWSKTDSWPWGTAVTVTQPVGNLNVTVRNFSGACGSGSTVSGARVIRYTSSWGYLDERTTNSSGVASWSNIPAGTYNLEAYYNGEYWVNGSASVTSGGTTTTTLLRNEPHAYDFKVFKGSTEVTGGSVLTGTALTFRVYVRNCSPVSRLVRVKLWLDRDQTGSDDFSQTSPSQTLSSGGGTAQFDFSYTPTQTGTYHRRLEVETTVVNWSKTDSWPWGTAVTVTQPVGNLNVTVRNFSGACGSGSTVSGARVIRYTSSWGYLDERTTNSSGVASWSNIPAGTYNLEAYYNGEYWVNGSASVTSGGTTTTTLLRNEPHAYDFKVFKGSTEVTGGSVLTGTALTFRVYVRNCSPVSRLVRVKLWLDRDQTGSDDFSQTSPSQTLSSGGGTAQFDFSYTPTQTGTYHRRLEVETTVVNWSKTDSWPWGTAVTVTQPVGNLNVTVRNFSGACGSGSTVSGARVIRYTSSWGYLDERTTNSSGVASWSNIPAGTYNLEAYYNGEYWVNGSASVTSGGTTTTTLLRNEPHAYDFKVFKGSTEVTGGSVLTGTALTFRVYVRNCSPVSRLVRVKLWLDRDQTGSDDFSQTSPSQTLSSGGGTAQFDFSYTPTQTGTYHRRLEVETTVVNWSKSDSWPWGTAVTVQPATGSLHVCVQNQDGVARPGATCKLYDTNYNYISGQDRTTDGSGCADWTNLSVGSYIIEAYYAGSTPFPGLEYWGNVYPAVVVNAGQTTSRTIRRDQPYASAVEVYNNSTNQRINAGDSFLLGTPLRVEVVVSNREDFQLPARIRLLLDRDRAASYDQDQTSSSQCVPGHDFFGNPGTARFIFYCTPTSPGTYYYTVRTDTDVSSGNCVGTNWVKTDGWDWTPSTGAFVVTPPPTVSERLFDDFSYGTLSELEASICQWRVRTFSGGPGPDGAQWLREYVSLDYDGAPNRIVKLSARTDGTGGGTIQSQINTPLWCREGTYCARIRFTNAFRPAFGVRQPSVQAFYTAMDLIQDCDFSYSECDFEYLPHDTWCGASACDYGLYLTTWETARSDGSFTPCPSNPIDIKRTDRVSGLGDAWHTYAFEVMNGQVKYYVDGVLKATHGGDYYPESPMYLALQHWFFSDHLSAGTILGPYSMDVDWVYYAKNTRLTTAQVESVVFQYRVSGQVNDNTLVVADTSSPTVSITSPTNGQTFTTSSITVSGTAADPGSPSSGVSLVEVRANAGAWQSATGTTSWSRGITLASGSNTIDARSKDVAGNYSPLASVSVTYNPPDTTNPTVAITSPTNGQTFTTSSITVSGTAADPGSPSSGVSLVEVRANAGAWQSATGTTSWSRGITLASGSNTIDARSKDVAGNYSPLASVSVTYNPPDTTNPTVAITSPTNGQTFTTSSITVSGTAADPGSPSSGVSLVEVRANAGAWQSATGTTSWSRGITLASGSNTIDARSKDVAGNYSPLASVSVTYNPPDTTNPTVAITSPTNGQTFTTSSITVSGTAADPGSPSSGVSLVEVRANAGAWQSATGTTSWSRGITLASGSNTIDARSKDVAGNYSPLASVSVTYNPPSLTWYRDADGDGYGNPNDSLQSPIQPNGYVSDGTDCNDNNATVHPGAPEVCGNGVDDDCVNGDQPCSGTWYRDADGDGYGNPSDSVQSPTQPAGYVSDNTDCNDNNTNVHPGAAEVCGNGIDDDCVGGDLPCNQTWYADADLDGYGNPSVSVQSPIQPIGYVSDHTDCDDGNANVHPGAVEVCGNGIDDDCVGGDQPCNQVWFRDFDGDGYGNPNDSIQSATQPNGYVSDGTDCNDNNANVHPSAPEVCGNGVDDDCVNGDQPCSGTWYRDADGDGYGNPSDSVQSPTQPAGYVSDNTDCNDNCSSCHPGGTEVCDGKDNDCDGQVDEGGVCVQPSTWYRDADGDGYGNPAVTTQAVQQPAGYVANDDDCDDNCSSCHPGGSEVCDGKDNDCDGQVDEGGVCVQPSTWYRDADGDGYGNPAVTTQAVQQPAGYVANDDDCDDNCSSCHPGGSEVCDGKDNDCDGQVDEGGVCGAADTDSDGDGTPNSLDGCPNDPNKIAPGVCGCGVADTDSDGDGTPNCNDRCPNTPGATQPNACGQCGGACGVGMAVTTPLTLIALRLQRRRRRW